MLSGTGSGHVVRKGVLTCCRQDGAHDREEVLDMLSGKDFLIGCRQERAHDMLSRRGS